MIKIEITDSVLFKRTVKSVDVSDLFPSSSTSFVHGAIVLEIKQINADGGKLPSAIITRRGDHRLTDFVDQFGFKLVLED